MAYNDADQRIDGFVNYVVYNELLSFCFVRQSTVGWTTFKPEKLSLGHHHKSNEAVRYIISIDQTLKFGSANAQSKHCNEIRLIVQKPVKLDQIIKQNRNLWRKNIQYINFAGTAKDLNAIND